MPDDPAPINFCVHCGEYLRPGVTYCPKCGTPVAGSGEAAQQPSYGHYGYGQPNKLQPVQTKKSFYAGILLLLAGMSGFVTAISVYLDRDAIVAEAEAIYGQAIPGAEGIIIALAVAWVIIGVMTIIGAYAAFQRKWLALAVIGGVMGLFSGGIIFLEGSLMALVALVLILMSRSEFKR